MLIRPSPNTYDRFKETHALLVQKHDDTLAFTKGTSFSDTFVEKISVIFSNTPGLRLDLFFGNPTVLVTTLLVDFPDAIIVSSIDSGT
jgi:hypothetical protein